MRRLPMNTRGIGGYGLVPDAERGDVEKALERLRAGGYDGAMIARLVGVDGPTPWATGSLKQVPVSYRTLSNYYVNATEEAERSSGLSTPTVVRVQMNVYAVASEALVWSAASRTFNPEETRDVAGDVAKVAVEDAPEGRPSVGGMRETTACAARNPMLPPGSLSDPPMRRSRDGPPAGDPDPRRRGAARRGVHRVRRAGTGVLRRLHPAGRGHHRAARGVRGAAPTTRPRTTAGPIRPRPPRTTRRRTIRRAPTRPTPPATPRRRPPRRQAGRAPRRPVRPRPLRAPRRRRTVPWAWVWIPNASPPRRTWTAPKAAAAPGLPDRRLPTSSGEARAVSPS